MHFPPDIRKTMSVDVQISNLHTHLFEGIEPEMDAGIIVNAEKIELVLDRDFDFHGAGKGKFDDENAGPECINYGIIVEVVCRFLQEPVEGVPFFPWSEY